MIFLDSKEFERFQKSVVGHYRFIQTVETQRFLSNLSLWINQNTVHVRKGTLVYRAQIASSNIKSTVDYDQGFIEQYYPAEKDLMIPKPEFAKNSRLSPKGIAVLYLASDETTALQECRPIKEDYVTVAGFEICKDLRIVAFDEYRGILSIQEVSGASDDEVIINEINHSFCKFVRPTDSENSYLPTQIIAELVKSLGLDGVGYMSSVGTGYNLALFDCANAVPLHSKLFWIRSVKYDYSIDCPRRTYTKNRNEI